GKMKSREGTVVDADDLMAAMIDDAYEASKERVKQTDMPEEEAREVARKVGLGALKYFILKVDARKNMLFNPEESIDFNGNTGPFIQYTYARIASILRKAKSVDKGQLTVDVSIRKVDRQGDSQLSTINYQLSTKETELIQKLSQFPVALRQAGTDYSPSGICNYCYELTKAFNQFYHDFTILGEQNEDLRQFRLSLAKAVAKVISLGMGLLGIEMPERM
ncbi:MAG: arginine--tRNA ligase, partial [Bacteroidaceae bacterium]|nr:arginine--tRNA ligase [Bacteroidaceae bacterium]